MMCLSALCEGWETLISVRLVASLEEKAQLESVDGKPFSGGVSTQHFLALNHFCFGLAALWLCRGLKMMKKLAFKALSQSGFLSLIEKLLMVPVLAFHALQPWLFLSGECHEAKALPKISFFPDNWIDCSFPLLDAGDLLPCWDCIFHDSVISIILPIVQLYFQKEDALFHGLGLWIVLWTLYKYSHYYLEAVYPPAVSKIMDQEQEGASGDGYFALTLCQNRDRLPGFN